VLPVTDIRRIHLGHFTRPEGDEWAEQKIVVVAYLLRHPEGVVLFDTGIGEGHPEADAIYRPVRRPFEDALAIAGARRQEIDVVINCHLSASLGCRSSCRGSSERTPKSPITRSPRS
jgi:N-acyl homoserine lactone hydrolase